MNIEKVLRWIVLIGVCAMPAVALVVTHSTFFPFVVGKNLVFRVLVEVLLVSWVALAFLNAAYRPRASVILFAITAFVSIVAVADIFGANFAKSFWSNFERMEGLITLLHLLAYFVVAGSIFASERVSLLFWRISLGVASLVSLHALLQFLDTGKYRLDSTLGNPIYLAVYALFHIFIALILAARHGANRTERAVYVLVLPLLFWVLFMTATRGAILGAIGGLLLATVGTLFALRKKHTAQIIAGVVMAAIVVGVGSFWFIRDTQFVQDNPVLKRFASISLTEGTVFARTVVWSMAWEGVKERPLLGWGQENFNLVFNKHYDPRMYAQEPWFDRTHNAVFDWLIAAGILGLLAYIAIFLSMLWVIYKTRQFGVVQKWFLVGLLAAYGFHNLTVFDQIVSYILFFSLAAWIMASSHDVLGRELWVQVKTRIPSWAIIVLVLLVAGSLVFGLNQKILTANRLFLSGLQESNKAAHLGELGRVDEANMVAQAALNKLVRAGTYGFVGRQEVHEHLAQTATQLIRSNWMTQELKSAWVAASVAGLVFEESEAPGDARSPVFLAQLYSAADNIEKEHEALLRAHEISPQKQSILIELAANALRRGSESEARTFIQQAFELEPSYKTAGVLYAIRLVLGGEIELYDKTFERVTYIGTDPRILSLLIDLKEHERAQRAWELSFQSTLNPRYAFLLGGLYKESGDLPRAKKSIERAIEIDPRAYEEGNRIIKSLE